MKELESKQEEFWLAQFGDGVPVLDLPTDYERPEIRSFKGEIVTFMIPGKETGVLNALAMEAEATLFVVLLAIFNIFLSRLSGQEDIVIGTPAAGRNHADLDSIIGMFVNTLALRNYPQGKKTFKEFLRDVKERVLNAFENQDYQFEDLVGKAAGGRSSNRTPLFDVMVALQNMDAWDGEIPGLKVILDHDYRFDNRISKFDMVYILELINNTLSVELEYSTELFKGESIEIYIDYFKQIVSIVVENPGIKLEDIKIAGDWFDKTLTVEQIDFDF
jgi:non-ribosomal peptide synthetase component F